MGAADDEVHSTVNTQVVLSSLWPFHSPSCLALDLSGVFCQRAVGDSASIRCSSSFRTLAQVQKQTREAFSVGAAASCVDSAFDRAMASPSCSCIYTCTHAGRVWWVLVPDVASSITQVSLKSVLDHCRSASISWRSSSSIVSQKGESVVVWSIQ